MPLQNPQDVAAHAALPSAHHYAPKVKLETRVKDAASGDVGYTGYGFQPTGLIIVAMVGNSTGGSIGSSEPAEVEQVLFKRADAIKAAPSIVLAGTAGAEQDAVLKQYDADGFTLTWTKVGVGPSDDVNLHVFAFK